MLLDGEREEKEADPFARTDIASPKKKSRGPPELQLVDVRTTFVTAAKASPGLPSQRLEAQPWSTCLHPPLLHCPVPRTEREVEEAEEQGDEEETT